MANWPIEIRGKLTYNKQEVRILELFTEIEKVLPEIESLFGIKSLHEFLECPYNDLSRYHFSLGMWIRNQLLQQGNLLMAFRNGGIIQKDDMSILILQLFYVYIRTKQIPLSMFSYPHEQ